MRIFLIVILSHCLYGCSVITVPIKVATTAVGTAADIVTTTADVIIPDGDDTETAEK